MSGRRVGILGGTFDPIHRGHLDVADAAAHTLALTSVFLIPSNIPPHRPQPFASAYHRFAMVALAVAERPAWRAVDLELRSTTPSYTSSTLGHLRNRGYAPNELFFIIGADAFCDIASWHDYPAILNAAHFVVVSRPGSAVSALAQRLPDLAARMVTATRAISPAGPAIILVDAPTADVSSTAIRQTLGEGTPIDEMVPAGVRQHIEQHGLYIPGTPGRRASDGLYPIAAGRLHGED
jgi:nicotinate-nucleotide adenylyltransferase